ncbi:polysaccharide pyruvyl transferase family protein [Salmonirosea aquatica]|uniref:Polysaccharide pyruvyl transferase family protein n=1 Tax=Salmonirosea aquatica TaxID=2654236 RepID=A0A7C9BD29_9BACT|nr:polysaccharide pyruvyl transferase family protein [Cytophagaceae bacterium SJW1-29]
MKNSLPQIRIENSSRRNFLTSIPLLTATLLSLDSLASSAKGSSSKAKKELVLRSSWQTVNIGDIGHTPGVLNLLEKYLPEVNVRLWASDVGNGVREMLAKRFPMLEIFTNADKEAVGRALHECDFLLHGSGPSLVARSDVQRWHKETGKPFGVYGITFPGVYSDDPKEMVQANPLDIELLNAAAFAFFRDSVSLDLAKKLGVHNPIMEFCPDGAFAVDLRNDPAADAFMKEHGLEDGKFMCVIPRNRLTPWWEIPSKNRTLDEKKNARNEAMREHDNAPLREAIVAVVRQTPMKILICPEDETQVKLGRQILLDKLPDDVKSKVVWRDHYWLTDEAVSTYLRSAGIFGLEMHSPIMCLGNGIPAIVGRFAEQTSKGFMWHDIGMDEWLFDFDKEEDIARYVPAVLAMAQDPVAARKKAARGQKFVEIRQKATMNLLKKKLPSP